MFQWCPQPALGTQPHPHPHSMLPPALWDSLTPFPLRVSGLPPHTMGCTQHAVPIARHHSTLTDGSTRADESLQRPTQRRSSSFVLESFLRGENPPIGMNMARVCSCGRSQGIRTWQSRAELPTARALSKFCNFLLTAAVCWCISALASPVTASAPRIPSPLPLLLGHCR